VLGDRILQDRGDLVVPRLLLPCDKWHSGELRLEVARHLGLLARPDPGVAARLQAADADLQRLGLGHVLQHRVVLDRTLVDAQVDAGAGRQVEDALFLAAHDGPAGARREVQRLDAERVSRAEQLTGLGIP
jgi:hypothetical protein